MHGACLIADQRITAGDMSDVASSNVVVITAGLRRKPDESRLDLINRNVDLFLNLLEQMTRAGLKDNAYLVVVSNPVDVLDLPCGTALRSAVAARPRPRHGPRHGAFSQLSRQAIEGAADAGAGDDPRRARRQHGAGLVERHRCRAAAGAVAGLQPEARGQEVFDETKKAGATIIKLKGGPGMAVGLSIREVVAALALDSRRVLPVSTLQQGLYGMRDVCLSVPTIVGCGGARQQIDLPLTTKERLGIQNSARVLREIIDQVEAAHRQGANEKRGGPDRRGGERQWPRDSANGVAGCSITNSRR